MFVSVLLAVVVCVVFYFCSLKHKKSYRLPPGPKGYPLIGNSFQVTEENLHHQLNKWAREYGKIFKIRLFGNTTMVINSADLVGEELLREPNATIFSHRLPTFFGKHFCFNHSSLALSGYDEPWTKRRKIAHHLLREYSAGVKGIQEYIQNDLLETTERIKAANGVAIDLDYIVTDSLYSLITILIMGRKYESGSQMIKFMQKYDSLIAQMAHPGTNFLLKWLPVLTIIPGPISRLYKELKQTQSRFREIMMNEKRNVGKYEGAVHKLFEEQMRHDNRWPTDDEILGILTDIELGGILTSKGLLLSLIWILAFRSDIQTRMQKEVDHVTGTSRKPTIQDKQNMPYTEAVMMEGLRYFSQLPLLVPHATSSDAKLGGYDIPENSTVLINSWYIHHDVQVWDQPWKFMPERFLNEDGKLLDKESIVRKSYMPFGIGKRTCIGEAFGKNKNFLFIATMMKNFTFYPAKEDQDQFDPRELKSELIMMPDRFECRAVERQM